MAEPIGPTHAEIITVDGAPVRVHGDAPLGEDGRAAVAEVIRAAREKLAAERPTDEDLAQWGNRLDRMQGPVMLRSWARRLLEELRLERERNQGEHLGYITGYRDFDESTWQIEYDGLLMTREEAIDDLHEAVTEYPAEWHVLEVRIAAWPELTTTTAEETNNDA